MPQPADEMTVMGEHSACDLITVGGRAYRGQPVEFFMLCKGHRVIVADVPTCPGVNAGGQPCERPYRPDQGYQGCSWHDGQLRVRGG